MKAGLTGLIVLAAAFAGGPAFAEMTDADLCAQLQNLERMSGYSAIGHAQGLDPNDILGKAHLSDLALGPVPCSVTPGAPTEVLCSLASGDGVQQQLADFVRTCAAGDINKAEATDDGKKSTFWFNSGVMLKLFDSGDAVTFKFVY
jgi:hypothetical protein